MNKIKKYRIKPHAPPKHKQSKVPNVRIGNGDKMARFKMKLCP